MAEAEVLKNIENFWDDNLEKFLTKEHGTDIRRLINTFKKFRTKQKNVEDLLFESKMVLDHTWERLNMGKWMDVPVERKQVYAIASYFKIIGLLHENKSNALKKSLEVTDLGILLGFPFRSLSLTKVADILSSKIGEEVTIASKVTSRKRSNPEVEDIKKKMKLGNEVDCVTCPSLELFNSRYFTKNRPVKLLKVIDHWPALELWKDLEYIVKKAGHRTVPVELGKNYADESYSQKLMKISDFVSDYFGDDTNQIGYLAQHQLFDQVPELMQDIKEPDYCALSQCSDVSSKTEINAWFGPKGTVSPLHFDPKHNLLCQVVGFKKIILYHQKYSPCLYPHESSLLFNTSRVDVENPDLNAFPEFSSAVKEECLLGPGEVLYIPPKYWHFVRSLDKSFSVSFWWE